MRKWLLVLALALGACTSTRQFAATGYTLPQDRPVTILVMRPDVEVGSMTSGGVGEPNADWTASARRSLAVALQQNQAAKGNTARLLPDQQGEAAQLVSDYEHLHRAVATSIAQFKYGNTPLPTKRKRFDWTLGPEASRLGTLGGGDYALFLFTRDSFATSGRKAMQVVGLLLGAYVPAGQHFAYASLVDLRSGEVVWFNVLSGSAGDIREAEGARGMVDRLMASMPGRVAKKR